MRISEKKKEKIIEQILALLYSSPTPLYTANIASQTARDEEFIKSILIKLKKKGFVSEIKKNPEGVDYLKRSRWKLSDEVYSAYRKQQGNKFL